MLKNRLLVTFLLFSLAGGLFGLEIQRGKLKLVVNERSGRFSLYGSEDQVKPVWTPLFLAEDPTTSKWKLLVGERTYVLGDDSAFTTAVEATATGVKVTWTSKLLAATLQYDFLVSSASTVADGLRLGFSVVNVSDSTLKVGVRWVLDTNLGEKKEHFQLPNGDVIASETKWEGSMPAFWVSRSTIDSQLGLIGMTGKGATTPSRILFANWRRLDDTPWELAYKQGRDFNLLPYSFNDSAIAHYFDAQELSSGSSREVVVLLGLLSAQTLEGSRVGSANPLDDLLKKGQNPALGAIDQDLVSLQTLLAQIDAKLSDPSRVTSEDLKLLQAVIDQIAVKRKSLEAAKP